MSETQNTVHPDDYSQMSSGEHNTASDAVHDDFVYQEITSSDGQVRRIRRPVFEAQNPPPYPENLGDTEHSPEETDESEHEEKEGADQKKKEEEKLKEEYQNGVNHDDRNLPPLQQKIDEAEAILEGKQGQEKEKNRDRGRGETR